METQNVLNIIIKKSEEILREDFFSVSRNWIRGRIEEIRNLANNESTLEAGGDSLKACRDFIAGWPHFCKCINFNETNLDAEAIKWFNVVPGRIQQAVMPLNEPERPSEAAMRKSAESKHAQADHTQADHAQADQESEQESEKVDNGSGLH